MRDQREALGVFLCVVAVPLVFTPFAVAPFADGKLVLLVASAAVLAPSIRRADRRVAAAALAWIASLVVSTFLSVDPWVSVFGEENRAVGLIAFAVAAILLVCGTGLGEGVRARIPTWLFNTGLVVSAALIVGRFVSVGGANWNLGTLSSTIGHYVFVGAFLSVAIVASTRVRPGLPRDLGLLLLGSGLSVSTSRAAWIGTAAGLVLLVATRSVTPRAVLRCAAPVVIALIAWSVVGPLGAHPTGRALTAANRFTEVAGSTASRVVVWKVEAGATFARPLFGWGPGNSFSAYLTHASAKNIAAAEARGFGDAHNLGVELFATTGVIGLLAFLVLVALVLRRCVRGAPSGRWAAAAAFSLGITHLVEPKNIVITPLMFLLAGLAASAQGDGSPPRAQMRSTALVIVALSIALAGSIVRVVASSAERYGSAYSSEAALRLAIRLDPSRITAAEALAMERSTDFLALQTNAKRDALAIIGRAVARHPWDPGVRLVAANVAHIVKDDSLAEHYLRAQLRRFPDDPTALLAAAVLASGRGDEQAAKRLVQRSLLGDPQNDQAQKLLRAVEIRLRAHGARH